MDRQIVAVISLKLLSCGIEYIDALRVMNHANSPKELITAISFVHPILGNLAFDRSTIDKINGALVD
jgi:hypothetical protein